MSVRHPNKTGYVSLALGVRGGEQGGKAEVGDVGLEDSI